MLVLGKEVDAISNNENVVVQGLLILKKDFGKYKDLVIDDFTNLITVRVFDLDIEKFEEGDFIAVYGYIKEYNETKKVYAKDIYKIKESDFFYWFGKILEEKNIIIDKEESKLKVKNEESKENSENEIVNEKESNDSIEVEFPFEEDELTSNITEDIENLKSKIIEILRNSPNKEISIDELYKKINAKKEDIDKALEEIADEIFEPKPGIIKLIEI
jgi:DNA-directed RNA polymerase beta' subunit